MSSAIPVEFQNLMRYDAAWHVIICLQCKFVILKQSVFRHIRKYHGGLKREEKKVLSDAVDARLLVEDATEWSDARAAWNFRILRARRVNKTRDLFLRDSYLIPCKPYPKGLLCHHQYLDVLPLHPSFL